MDKPKKQTSDAAEKIKMIVFAIKHKHKSIDNWIKLHKEYFLEEEKEEEIAKMIRMIKNFSKQTVNNPRSKRYTVFRTLAGISNQEFELSCENFSKVISQKFSIEERFLHEETRYIGSARLGLESDASHIRDNFNNNLKEYWVGIHYWDANPDDKIINTNGNIDI